MKRDRSNGWEAVATDFIRNRARSTVGATTVREWARGFSKGASVLDLGCGSGIPISKVLVEAGLSVYGVEASPTMAAEFQRSFPEAPIACEPAEESSFFYRTFDGIVSWGLMFLLPEAVQRAVIALASMALLSGGLTASPRCPISRRSLGAEPPASGRRWSQHPWRSGAPPHPGGSGGS